MRRAHAHVCVTTAVALIAACSSSHPPAPLAYGEYRTRSIAKACALERACKLGGASREFADADGCEEAFAFFHPETLPPGAPFDADAAARCLDAPDTGYCVFNPLEEDPWTTPGALGCPLYTTAVPFVGEGERCGEGVASCVDGLECSSRTESCGTCVRAPRLGEACSVECAGGNRYGFPRIACLGGECVATTGADAVGEGEACDYVVDEPDGTRRGVVCAPGLACGGATAPEVCIRARAAGATCGPAADDCGPGLACVGGACTALVIATRDGDACDAAAGRFCDERLRLYCVSGRCTTVAPGHCSPADVAIHVPMCEAGTACDVATSSCVAYSPSPPRVCT